MNAAREPHQATVCKESYRWACWGVLGVFTLGLTSVLASCATMAPTPADSAVSGDSAASAADDDGDSSSQA
jgi:hypothetical protein